MRTPAGMTWSLLAGSWRLQPSEPSYQKGLEIPARDAGRGWIRGDVPGRAAKIAAVASKAVSPMVTTSGFPRSEPRGLPTRWRWPWNPRRIGPAGSPAPLAVSISTVSRTGPDFFALAFRSVGLRRIDISPQSTSCCAPGTTMDPSRRSRPRGEGKKPGLLFDALGPL